MVRCYLPVLLRRGEAFRERGPRARRRDRMGLALLRTRAGRPLDARHAELGNDRREVSHDEVGAIRHQRNVAELCASEGIDFQWEKVKPGNTRLAHRIIQVAQTKGLGTKAAEVLFEAYMNEGEAIGERSVIERIAARIGFSDDEIDATFSSRVIEDQIAADQQTAMEIGVTGVPFFVIDGKIALSGAQPRHVFEQALDRVLLSKFERIEDDQAVICDANGCRVPGT
jgi:predicted DsbA family dithiol-disulfide isomerase